MRRETANHLVMTKPKAEKHLTKRPNIPKKKCSPSYPFELQESLEGKFQKKIQTALSETDQTVKTDTGSTVSWKFSSGSLFQTETKTPSGTINKQ